MESSRKNRAIYIDREAIYTLSLAKEGLLNPVKSLMSKKEAIEVDRTRIYLGKSFPFSFLLAPSGKRNEEILKSSQTGEVLDLICNGMKYGEIVNQEIFPIDKMERVKNIFQTMDMTHPGVQNTLRRLGNYAIYGEYSINFDDVKDIRVKIERAKKSISAKNITALMLAGKPLHRAHERLIRLTLDKSDLIVIFLLKPHYNETLSYNVRYKSLKYFVDNYLPKNRVIIVPLENTYIFAGNNEAILDAIVAQNFGCNRIIIGQNHAGLGVFYDKNSLKSIFDTLKGMSIEIDINNEFVYCNVCNTLVSTSNCPHGQHHHIHYHSESIMELLKEGLLPPAVLVRKEISAIILSEFFPNRFKNIEKLYYDILPLSGLLENHSEKEFYIELMKLYKTSSLN